MKEQNYLIVDLDLPSGIKWADRNVGAENPWDNGAYFSWGNVDGHAVDENGKTTDSYTFNPTTYATTSGGQYTGNTLDAEHDAATVNMGKEWRMPTSNETVELFTNTDYYYIGEDGSIVAESELSDSKPLHSICFVKKGEIFDYENRSNFIEFPFAGNCNGSLLDYDGFGVYVWLSSVYDGDSECVHYLSFGCNGDLYGELIGGRFHGFSVRGVTFKK